MAVQLPLPLCTCFFWRAVTAFIYPDAASKEHGMIFYLLLLSWLFNVRDFPLEHVTEKSVSAKVLCIATNVHINRLPKLISRQGKPPQWGKTLLGTARLLPSLPCPFLPKVLSSWKGWPFSWHLRRLLMVRWHLTFQLPGSYSFSTVFQSTSQFFACVARGAHSF